MSEKLYKLGKWIFSHRWRVIGIWLVVVIAMGTLSAQVHKPFDPGFTIPGTEAQTALDKLSAEAPEASAGTGSIVFAVPKGQKLVDQKAAVEQAVTNISEVDGVASAMSPFITQTVSQDGRIGLVTVRLNKPTAEVAVSTQESILEIVTASNNSSLQVEERGDTLAREEAAPIGELVGFMIAALVLVITFGSIVAAGMPLLIAIIAVAMGMLGIYGATSLFNISSTATTLAVMLGLAVGIDYTLFLIVRYIKYLKEGIDPHEAVGRMVATSGNAVIFAALTVIIALSALSVTGIPFLKFMGIGAAFTVGMAAIAAITIVPALLSFARFNVVNKKERQRITLSKPSDESHVSHTSIAYRWVSLLTKMPVMVLVVTIIGLVAIALPATKIQLGLPDDGTAASQSTQRKAYDLLTEGFGAGFNAPLIVVADLPSGLSTDAQQAELVSIASNLKKDSGVAIAVPGGATPSGKTGILQVYPATGPNDTETKDLIKRIREHSDDIAGADTKLSVTGSTAIGVDVDSKLAKALPVYLVVVVGLSLLVLLAVFRSIVVPIKATAGFLLTIFATLGLLVMFFQWGWLGLIEAGPVLSFLPILVTGILFGLAMDYQFFLVSGMHEEYAHDKDNDAKAAVINGYAHGAKVVTVAAIIMIVVFASFIFTDDATIKSIGFALAIGVFIDAFIVRMTIVPAVMTLFGQKAWWLPTWLNKIVPNLAIEGDESVFQKTSKK
jgi:RND superfamily putative drug exporter